MLTRFQKHPEGTVFKDFWIVNDLYGGYSFSEGEQKGSCDYVATEEILTTAELLGQKVHLAGSRWREFGMKGYGQEVDVALARSLVQRMKVF